MRRLFLALLLFAPAALAQQFNQRAAVSASSSGDNTLVAGVASQSVYVYGIDLLAASSVVGTLKCGSTALTGAMTMTAYQKNVIPAPAYWVCPAGASLILNLGTGVQVSGAVWFAQQ